MSADKITATFVTILLQHDRTLLLLGADDVERPLDPAEVRAVLLKELSKGLYHGMKVAVSVDASRADSAFMLGALMQELIGPACELYVCVVPDKDKLSEAILSLKDGSQL